MAPLVRTGGSRHTGLAALPHRNIQYSYLQIEKYIADKITSLCEKRDISKYRLSQLSGISQSSLGRIMAQENLPSLITLEKICTALGVTLSQFFLLLNVKTVMFFLCTAEHYSIINPVLLHKFKGYNKENGKPDESLGRKARRG